MSVNERADVVVPGLGHAGAHIMRALAEAGLDVVGVGPRLVAGERGHWGHIDDEMTPGAGYLLSAPRPTAPFARGASRAAGRSRTVGGVRGRATGDRVDRRAADLLAVKRERFVPGRGRLTGPCQVSVGERTFHARRGVVPATGAQPRLPAVRGLSGTPYWTDENAMAAVELPASLIVLGDCGLGVETARLFARFRCAVTVVERQPRLLSWEEPEASTLTERALLRDGVTVLTSAGASEVAYDGTGFTVHLDGGTEPLRGERMLVTTERQADLTGPGLDTAGLVASSAVVPADGQMRAGRGLRAVGDVTGRGPSSDVALYQAEVAVGGILGWPGPDTDYQKPARLVYTDPEIAAVGLTERQARNQRLRVRTSLLPITSSDRRGPQGRRCEGFVKLVEDADRGVLVGATSAGPAGAEVLYALNVAVHAEMSVERLRHAVPACVPFHRTVEAALGGLC
ncbi:FAD-dependent oxidoreductase [Streptomyces sp. NPDC033753]|uniref:FAD-dependent oxidoreductase n=1 Tax=Streptomyces sp. NPDC033753 TaxID=3155128 RepID=UPI0033D52F2B